MADSSEKTSDILMQTGEVHEFLSDEDAYKFISDQETITCKKYKTQKTTNIHDNASGCDICWDDFKKASGCGSNSASLPYDGIPFIVLGNEEMACIQNVHVQDPCKETRKRKLLNADDHDYGTLQEKRTCPARVTICKIIKFPQFRNKGKDTRSRRTILSEKLKTVFNKNSTVKKYKVYVRIPEEDEHRHTAPDVLIEEPVKIPLQELLKSLSRKVLENMVKKEKTEMGVEDMEIIERDGNMQEELVEECGISELVDNEQDMSSTTTLPSAISTPTKMSRSPEFEATSPRNIAASALASMNAGPTNVMYMYKPMTSQTVSSQPTPASQTPSTPSKLVLVQTPSQNPHYVLLNTSTEDVSYSASPIQKGLSAKMPSRNSSPYKQGRSVQVVPERKMKIVPWRGIEGSVRVSDTCFYTDDRKVMDQCIKQYEEDTYSVFRCNKTTKIDDLELTEVKHLDNHRVRWCPLSDQWKPADHVPDDVPYLVLGRESRMCRFNGRQNTNKVKKKAWCGFCNKTPEEQKSCTDTCTCRLRKSQKSTMKQPCPAMISIHSIIRFLDFRADTKKKRSEMLKNLRCGLELIEKLKMRIRQEKRIYVTLPEIEVHQNHPIFKLKLENPCCPCYRTGTCGTCPCKLTGCSGCNNNECRYRDSEGNYKPLRQTRKKKGSRKPKITTLYAAKSIRNMRINADELSLNEQLEREAELEVYQEHSVVLKIQQEILGMSHEHARSTLLQMLEDDPFHVESYVNPDPAPYHRVQVDTPPKWCSCTQCVEMDNSQMRMCCSQMPCLSFQPMFRSVCLRPDHLLMGILDLGLPTENFADIGNFSNAQYRRQAYRCFILWQWNNLGKGDIEVPKPPSCVVARIRWRYPSIDNQYSNTFSPDSDFEEGNK